MSHREYISVVWPLAGKQKFPIILVQLSSMQVTKETWHMREQCLLSSLSLGMRLYHVRMSSTQFLVHNVYIPVAGV